MKRYVAILLCCVLLVRSASVPTFAASIVEEPELISFSYNYANDSIALTDDNGYIIEVRPAEQTIVTYGAAPVLPPTIPAGWTIIEGGLSAGAGGAATSTASATIAGSALPILAYVLAAGVVIWSVHGIAECIMDMYYLLSDAAKGELDEIMEEGSYSFTLSDYANLASELPQVFQTQFFTDDGTFKESGVTFDPSNMLEYDYSSQYVFSNDLTASIYKHTLGYTPVGINGTSLSLQLVDSPFSNHSDVTKAFKINNLNTNASLTFMPSYTTEWLDVDHCTYKFAVPAVQTYAYSDYDVCHTLGVWVLRECSIIASGGSCSSCYYQYQSQFYGESYSPTDTNLFLFEDTGISDLDGVVIDSQMYNGNRAWDYILETPMDGVEKLTLPYSALQTVVSDLEYPMTQTETAGVPDVSTPLYMPSADVMEDANNLTQTGALTGDWSTTQTDGSTGETPDTGGLWDTLFGWLKSILVAINNILDFLLTMIEKLVAALKDMILSLFIPSEGFFDAFVVDLKTTFEDRMGILTYPLSLLYDFCDHLLDVGEEEPVFTWTAWKYEGVEVIPGGSFNFNDILENETFAMIHDIYLLLVDVGIVYGLVSLLRKKYSSILSN